MKKAMIGICLFFILFCFQEVFAQGGTCGVNVAYTIKDRTITFSKADPASDAVWSSACGDVFKNDPEITRMKISDPLSVLEGYQLFKDFQYVQEMNLVNLDISGVTTLREMFSGCTALRNIVADTWDTSGVVSMNGMFNNCSSLKGVETGGWNTSGVTDMECVFQGCASLLSLDLGSWDTSAVTDTDDMFTGCDSLYMLTVGQNTLGKNIFTTLPQYYDIWSYTSKDAAASDPFPLWTVRTNAALFTEYDHNTMAGTWSQMKPPAVSVSIMDPAGTVITGQSVTLDNAGCQLRAAIKPEEAEQNIVWTSSDSAIAAVDESGNVTFSKAGTVTITAASAAGRGVAAVVDLKLLPEAEAIAIMDAAGADITGQTVVPNNTGFQLLAAVEPEEAEQNIVWTSSDSAVAAVDASGNVTFSKAGTVTITAAAGNGVTSSVNLLRPEAEAIAIMDAAGTDITGQTVVPNDTGFQLLAAVKPEEADQNIIWTSSDSAVAAVDASGNVTFSKAGKVTITAASGNGVTSSVNLMMLPEAASITIRDAAGTDITGKDVTLNTVSCQLLAAVEPEGAVQNIVWTSGDSAAAAVDAYGNVTFSKAGTVTITAASGNGVAASVNLTLMPEVTAITINDPAGSDITGQTVTIKNPHYRLEAVLEPADTDQTVTWSSSDSDVASVGESDVVTFSKAGTVTITAASEDGVTASVNLKLQPDAAEITIMNSDGVDVTGKGIILNTGIYQLMASAAPSDAEQTVTWASSDSSVAEVDGSGKVTFRQPGTVTITVTSTDRGRAMASMNLKLLPEAEAIRIMDTDGNNITGKTVTLNAAEYQLTAGAEPFDAAQTVTWKSSDPAAATVSAEGKVTFKKAGTVTITAVSTDRGKASASMNLKLLPRAKAVSITDPDGKVINGTKVTVNKKKYQLTAAVEPDSAAQGVTWRSSDTDIATVSRTGKVTFKKAGTVTITVTSTDRAQKSGKVKLTYKPAK